MLIKPNWVLCLFITRSVHSCRKCSWRSLCVCFFIRGFAFLLRTNNELCRFIVREFLFIDCFICMCLIWRLKIHRIGFKIDDFPIAIHFHRSRLIQIICKALNNKHIIFGIPISTSHMGWMWKIWCAKNWLKSIYLNVYGVISIIWREEC